jgi:hypothetical protein
MYELVLDAIAMRCSWQMKLLGLPTIAFNQQTDSVCKAKSGMNENGGPDETYLELMNVQGSV